MKKTIFIQNVPHWPTAWGDAKSAWNVGSLFQGITKSPIIRDYRQQLGFWSKQNFNIIIDVDKEDPTGLVLTHFFSQNIAKPDANSRLTAKIDLEQAMEFLDSNPKQSTCAFGTFFDPYDMGGNQESMISGAKFFARQIHPLVASGEEEIDKSFDSKFYLLDDPSTTLEGEKVTCICWFFMYRAVDLPIYYIIPNPDLIGVSPYIDTANTEDVRYMQVEAHFGSIGDLIFRPAFSHGVHELSPTKIIATDPFDVTPFERGVFRFGYNETVPKVNLKIHSNLKFTRDPESNKIHFEFKPGQDQGYLSVKWNYQSNLDITMSSRSLDNLENRCKFTYDVYKNSRL
jgi:hypothetical protein